MCENELAEWKAVQTLKSSLIALCSGCLSEYLRSKSCKRYVFGASANNECPDQFAHPRRLIGAFTILFWSIYNFCFVTETSVTANKWSEFRELASNGVS